MGSKIKTFSLKIVKNVPRNKRSWKGSTFSPKEPKGEISEVGKTNYEIKFMKLRNRETIPGV